MKIYTQAEFDAIERDENGWKNCPTGDYSQIRTFGVGCIFGECCRFGAGCRFGEGCRFEGGKTPVDHAKPYFAVDRIGSENRKAYFFNFVEGGVHVRAGCFFGTRAEFLKKLEADGGDKIAHYKAALALAEMVLGVE